MSDLTSDPSDPRLTRGIDATQTPQAPAYLILSEEERAKGFVRPIRRSYRHAGRKTCGKSTSPMQDGLRDAGYVCSQSPGHNGECGLWERPKEAGCGAVTSMSQAIAGTYARDPKFYGATYCCTCGKHLAVAEFVWDGTHEEVRS